MTLLVHAIVLQVVHVELCDILKQQGVEVTEPSAADVAAIVQQVKVRIMVDSTLTHRCACCMPSPGPASMSCASVCVVPAHVW